MVLGLLLAAALALITIDYRDGTASPLHSLSSFGGSVFGSAEGAVSLLITPVRQLAGGAGSQAKNASPRRQLTQARAGHGQGRLTRAKTDQLDRLLGPVGRRVYRILAANVVAAGPG